MNANPNDKDQDTKTDSEETRQEATDVDAGSDAGKEGTQELRRGAAELGEEAQLLDASNMVLGSGTVFLGGSAEMSVFQPETADTLDEATLGKVAKIRVANGKIGKVEALSPHAGTGHYHIGITGLESDE